MIVIIGKIDAVRKAAAERQIRVEEAVLAPDNSDAPFSRRRLTDMHLSQLIHGLGEDPEQAVIIAEAEKDDSFRLIMTDSNGDTEIRLDHGVRTSDRLAELLTELAPVAMAPSGRGRHIDIRA